MTRRHGKRQSRPRPQPDGWEGSPRAHEREVRAEVGALEAFDFLDAVSAVMAAAIDRAAGEQEAPGATSSLRKTAMLVAAIRAFRAIRAASSVLASGYAMEAEPYSRMLLELYVSAKAVVEDESDTEAQKWLSGDRGRGIGKKVRAAIRDPSVYFHLSTATHGDPRAVPRALLNSPNGERQIEWGPRLTPQTEEQLHHLAFAARDFMVLLEQAGFGACPELDQVDQALQRIKPAWRPDARFPPTRGPAL